MRFYKVVLEVRFRSSGRVGIVTFQEYADSVSAASDLAIDYSIQNLFYDVLNVLSVYEI